jgi:DNA repair exonuclease SbcCD nuclease subunit
MPKGKKGQRGKNVSNVSNAAEASLKVETRQLERGNKDKAVICADLHLKRKPGMWSGRSEIAGDDIFALQEVARVCKEYDADLYILGDTLDTVTNLPRPLVMVKEVFSELIEQGHSIRYIQGQHELVVQANYTNHPWLSLVSGTEHIHKCTFDFLGHKAYALDYFPSAYQEMAAEAIPDDVTVLMLHGTADAVFEYNSHFSVDTLIKDNIRLVIAGDFHEHVDKEINDNGARILYPGSAWLQSAKEQLDKYVYVVSSEDDKLSWEPIQLRTRPMVKISTIDCVEEWEPDFGDVSALPKELQRPVIIVDEPIEQTEYTRLASFGHIYSSASANPEHISAEDIDMHEAKTDEEVLETCIDKEKYPAQFEFTLDVIQNPAQDAIERLRATLGFTQEDLTPVAGSVAAFDDTELTLEGGGE